jgi:hypothetical protein
MENFKPAATAVCPICKERFVRGRYGNSYGSGERIEAQRFCGPACRQRAYRDRRDIENNVPVSARRRRPSKVRLYPRAVTQKLAETSKGLVAGSVTRAETPKQIQRPATPQKTNGRGLQTLLRDTRIVGPQDIIEAECFGPHSWQPSVSSDGVKIEVARLRQRALAA